MRPDHHILLMSIFTRRSDPGGKKCGSEKKENRNKASTSVIIHAKPVEKVKTIYQAEPQRRKTLRPLQ